MTARAACGFHEHGASGAQDDPVIARIKLNDLLRFADKWLTGDLYRRLAYEGQKCTPTFVAEATAPWRRALAEVGGHTGSAPETR